MQIREYHKQLVSIKRSEIIAQKALDIINSYCGSSLTHCSACGKLYDKHISDFEVRLFKDINDTEYKIQLPIFNNSKFNDPYYQDQLRIMSTKMLNDVIQYENQRASVAIKKGDMKTYNDAMKDIQLLRDLRDLKLDTDRLFTLSLPNYTDDDVIKLIEQGTSQRKIKDKTGYSLKRIKELADERGID